MPPKLQEWVEGKEEEMKVGWTAGGDDRVRSASGLEVRSLYSIVSTDAC